MRVGSRSSLAMGGALALAMGLTLTTASEAEAKAPKIKSCAGPEAAFIATGAGDRDGDGLSDCRETKQLRTLANDPDTDDDGLMDGEEIELRSDPRKADSDDDGLDDGEDEYSRIPEQKVEGILDALTCPSVGVVGTISVLGTTALLDAGTEFEDESCVELSELLAAGVLAGTPVMVEVEIAEDSIGVMTAIEVEVEDDIDYHDSDDDDSDDDED
jgi:hypothetical protein